MFQIRKFYKHQANTDVALEVKGCLSKDDEGISLIVAWWNIVRSNKGRTPRRIVPYQVVRIKREEVDNWKEFECA